jgi:hypothetical protein
MEFVGLGVLILVSCIIRGGIPSGLVLVFGVELVLQIESMRGVLSLFTFWIQGTATSRSRW